MERNLRKVIAFASAVCLFCTCISMPARAEETEQVQLFSAGDINYSWNFDTDETASSGNNTPVVSGTAAWDEANQNVKFDSSTTTAGNLTVSLNPAASGVVVVEFDKYLSHSSTQTVGYTIKDTLGNELVNLSICTYSTAGSLSVCGVNKEGCAELKNYISYVGSKGDDGMKTTATHFKSEINYPKKTVSVTISSAKGSNTYTEAISSAYADSIASVDIFSKRTTATADHNVYADNLSIKSETPENAIYATGQTSVTKRMGGTTASILSLKHIRTKQR